MLVDFEKAFDTIEWSFLIETLKAFNFGETSVYQHSFICFKKWISEEYSTVAQSQPYSSFQWLK